MSSDRPPNGSGTSDDRSRGTPPGRDPLPGRARTARLLVLTVALVLASAAVLAGVALFAD